MNNTFGGGRGRARGRGGRYSSNAQGGRYNNNSNNSQGGRYQGGRGSGGTADDRYPIARLTPCGDFTISGECPNGTKCRFAHVCRHYATIDASTLMPPKRQTNNYYDPHEPQSFPVASAAIWESPTGIKIFTGSHDGYWRLWNTNNFSKEFEHNMSGGHVEALEIANNFLFVGFEAQSVLLPDVKVGMIHAWNLATPTNPPLEFHMQTSLMPYAHSACVTALKVVTGEVILSGDRNGVVRLWKFDGAKFALTNTLHGHAAEVTSLVVIDQLLWSASVDKSIRLWDLSNNECRHLITSKTMANGNPVGHTSAVTALLTFNMPNGGGAFVLSSSLDGTIKVWNGTNGECVASETHGEGVVSMALSEDQKKNPILLIGLERGNIMVRNVLQTQQAPAFCLLYQLSNKYTIAHSYGAVKTIREGPSSTFYTGGQDGKLLVFQICGDLGI